MLEDKNFEIEISDFKLVPYGKLGKALRYTVAWKFLEPRFGLIAQVQEGWLATKRVTGEVCISPPLTTYKPGRSKQLSQISYDFHNLIASMIANHRTKAGKCYFDLIGNRLAPEFMAKTPVEVDEDFAELAEEIKA